MPERCGTRKRSEATREPPQCSGAVGPGTEEKTPEPLLPIQLRKGCATQSGMSSIAARMTSSSAGAWFEDFMSFRRRSVAARAEVALDAPVWSGIKRKQRSFLISRASPVEGRTLMGTQNFSDAARPPSLPREPEVARARAKQAATTALTVEPLALATSFTRCSATVGSRATRLEPESAEGLREDRSLSWQSCSTARSGACRTHEASSASAPGPPVREAPAWPTAAGAADEPFPSRASRMTRTREMPSPMAWCTRNMTVEPPLWVPGRTRTTSQRGLSRSMGSAWNLASSSASASSSATPGCSRTCWERSKLSLMSSQNQQPQESAGRCCSRGHRGPTSASEAPEPAALGRATRVRCTSACSAGKSSGGPSISKAAMMLQWFVAVSIIMKASSTLMA
mmetsp:Transcript_54819/g.169774  ORF Transcript_54819/g.169774 Transcript_54819/m.169774 type:complete len:397 (+) Transcript_54819:183-1373(+)